MRLLALLAGLSGCIAALFFLVTAVTWFGDPDGRDINNVQGLEAFAFMFIALCFGLFCLDRAGAARKEVYLQHSTTTDESKGTEPSEYRLHT